MYRGAALIETGLSADDPARIAHGLADGEAGLAAYHATGALLDVPTCLCWFAAGNLRLGNPQAASRQLDEARRVIVATGQTYFAAELERLAGELGLSASADHAVAQARFEAALSIARRQGARLLELRAATSLVRLLREHGQDADARGRLRTLCDGIPTGVSCRDTVEARAVLDSLDAGSR